MKDKDNTIRIPSILMLLAVLLGLGFLFQPALAVNSSLESLPEDMGGFSMETSPVCTSGLNTATALWNFNETTGSSFDDVIGVNDGACSGDSCPSPVAGVMAGGQFFIDSDGDLITIPASPDFEFTASSDFSVGVWVKTTQDCKGRKVFIGRYHPANGSGWIVCEADSGNPNLGYAAFHMMDTSGISSTAVGNTRINDGRWHYVVGVRDGTNDELKIYVDDGDAEDTVISPGYTGTFYSATDITIGAYHLPKGFHFQGSLDELAVFDSALTPAEINAYWSSCTFKPVVGDVVLETQQDTALEGIIDSFLLANSDGTALSINSVASISVKLGTISESFPGEYTYIPPGGFAGTDYFTFVVDDTDLDAGDGNAIISVVSSEFPKITQPENQMNDEGEVITPLYIEATDPNGDDLVFSAAGLPTGLSIGPDDGIISGTIPYTATGGAAVKDFAVTVSVTDNSPDANETSVNFNWRINRVNVPPVILNPGPKSNYEGDVVDFGILASDANDDPLTFTGKSLPPGLSIGSASGQIAGTISQFASTESPYNVKVTAEDQDGLQDSVIFTWTVNSLMKRLYLPQVTR